MDIVPVGASGDPARPPPAEFVSLPPGIGAIGTATGTANQPRGGEAEIPELVVSQPEAVENIPVRTAAEPTAIGTDSPDRVGNIVLHV